MKKKLLALAMAAVMMMGLSTTAFAATQNADGTYKDDETITITKNYELEGEGESPAETFYLTQVGSGTVSEDSEATSAPDLIKVTVDGVEQNYVASVSYAAGAAGSDSKTGTFEITLPSYSHTGVYTYTLQEMAGTTQGVSYRTSTIKLVVTVIEQDGLIRVASVHTEEITYDADGNVTSTKTDAFSDNIYKANTLSVTKTVDGNMGDTKKEFSFTVKFTAEAGKTWDTSSLVAKKDGVEVEDFALDSNGEYTFTLADGHTMSFENVPEGVTYTVTEDDYTSEGYTTTSTGSTGTMTSSAATAAFTNTKTGDVDTGINLDSLPYVMILGLVLIGAAYVISRRRLSDRY